MYWGLDGCRGGWVAVGLDDDHTKTIAVFASIQDFWDAANEQAKRVLIDIPIGLPDTAQRQVEGLARQKLQARRSSVFPVPARAVVIFAAEHNFVDGAYKQACDLNEEMLGKRFSKQAWNILPKIYEVDQFLQQNTKAQSIMLEAHPELLFWSLNKQQPMRFSKKSGVGFTERLRLIEQYLPDVFPSVESAYDQHKSILHDDDILDAFACALCARMDTVTSLPHPPEVDATGLPMQMVYPVL